MQAVCRKSAGGWLIKGKGRGKVKMWNEEEGRPKAG